MSEPTSAQMSCGFAQHGPPALCTCGTCLTPGYWMYETSGVLRPAVEAYLNFEPMTPEYIGAMRAYLRQWMSWHGWCGEAVDCLRKSIDGIVDRKSLKAWLDEAMDESIDPL